MQTIILRAWACAYTLNKLSFWKRALFRPNPANMLCQAYWHGTNLLPDPVLKNESSPSVRGVLVLFLSIKNPLLRHNIQQSALFACGMGCSFPFVFILKLSWSSAEGDKLWYYYPNSSEMSATESRVSRGPSETNENGEICIFMDGGRQSSICKLSNCHQWVSWLLFI